MRFEDINMAGRRKRGRRIRILRIFNFILIIIIAILIVLLFLNMEDRKVIGTWEYRVDYSHSIIEKTDEWLLDKHTQDFCASPVILDVDIRKDGTYSVAVDEESYSLCDKSAKDYLVRRFNALIASRLAEEGYEGSEDTTTVASTLINETLSENGSGSLLEYADESELKLIPDISSVKEEFSSEGTYEYDKRLGIIKFVDKNGNQTIKSVSISGITMVLQDAALEEALQVENESVEGVYPNVLIRKTEK